MKFLNPKRIVMAIAVALGLTMFATSAHAFFNVNWALIPGDPICPHRPGCYEQLHVVNLIAGTTYTIDMRSNQIDSYLYLEDSAGNVLAQDDDSGGNHDARIVFTPTVSGTYNVVATTFNPGATGN